MWARVKGATENALLRLPFKAAYRFRPGIIEPGEGITSKTKLHHVPYPLLKPVIFMLKRFAPNMITTTAQVGRAMIEVARSGAPKPLLKSKAINAL